MFELWSKDKPFPAFSELEFPENIEYGTIHTAIRGEYQFALGMAIKSHNGVLYASWANSWRNENDNNTILSQKQSFDGGKTWENLIRISKKDEGFGRSHGVYFSHGDDLYVFCPKASFDDNAYPNLETEAYRLLKDGSYECLGIVLPDAFWPMCEPIRLNDGTLCMAGIKATGWPPKGYGVPAVALCDGKDLLSWEMKVLPDKNSLNFWGETTVLKQKERLVAVVRNGGQRGALISESCDGGKTWTDLEESNFPMAESKAYAGILSDGRQYLVFTLKDRGFRDTLAIAVGNDTFERVYIIRDGFESKPVFSSLNEWCYPYAYEDGGKLFVAYTKNKEDCELAIIPISSL